MICEATDQRAFSHTSRSLHTHWHSIVVTLSGMVIEVSFSQYIKAELPMLIKDDGRSIDAISVKAKNARLDIDVIPVGSDPSFGMA